MIDIEGYRGFVFDFYDTLCYVKEDIFLEGKKRSAELLGVTFEDFFAIWKKLGKKNITGELYYTKDRVKETISGLNLGADEEIIEKISRLNDDYLVKAAIPYKGVEKIVEKLSEKYDLYILSNASSSVEEVIERFNDIFKHFKKIYFSYEHGLAKPDPNFYKLLIENESIDPNKYFYVGDGNDQELDIAKTFGFTTIKVSHEVMASYRFRESEHFDHDIKDLKELLPK